MQEAGDDAIRNFGADRLGVFVRAYNTIANKNKEKFKRVYRFKVT
jgi:hypothetical protein